MEEKKQQKRLPGVELVGIVRCRNCSWSKKARIEGEKEPMAGAVYCTLKYELKSDDWFCPLGIPSIRLIGDEKR